MNGLGRQEPFIFIQFAGQGVKYLEGLQQLFSMYANIRPFIQDAIAVIKEQASIYDDKETGFFPHGLDIDQWIVDPKKAPDLGYLLSSPLSHPLIFLNQISTYISVLQEGVDQDKLISNTHSATGFSTGIVAAVLVSLGLPLNALYEVALKTQAMFFWQGIRTQQSMLNYGARPTLDAALYDSEEGSPSCMASVNKITRTRLTEAIESFQNQGQIYIAYELFPLRWIVSGLPGALSKFRTSLKDKFNTVEWRYIPSTIGAHSPLLSFALEESPSDADRLGLVFQGKDMKIPVWANDTGEDIRQKDNIIQDIMRAYFVCKASWRKQIGPLVPPTNIKYVLDFGPGPGVASLTENHTTKSGIKVIRCSAFIGRKILKESILPELV